MTEENEVTEPVEDTITQLPSDEAIAIELPTPTFAWLNEGTHAVKPLDGSYVMICKTDTLWATMGIDEMIKQGNILPFDYDVTPEYPKSDEELAEEAKQAKMKAEREWRDNELHIADHTFNMALDASESTVTQSAYRVLLRDYPQCTGFPECGRPTISTIESGE